MLGDVGAMVVGMISTVGVDVAGEVAVGEIGLMPLIPGSSVSVGSGVKVSVGGTVAVSVG